MGDASALGFGHFIAQADIVAKHVSDAFSTTLRFARKSS